MKSCSASSPCQYRYINSGTIGYGCNYDGYCDFQLPRDSRSFNFPNDVIYKCDNPRKE